jgi:hypothetical protein
MAMTNDQIAELISPEFRRSPWKEQKGPGSVELSRKLFARRRPDNDCMKSGKSEKGPSEINLR